MKKKLKTVFYGVTHEHAPGKLRTLRNLADDFEIVAVVDDRGRTGWTFQDQRLDLGGFKVLTEDEFDARGADACKGIDVALVEVANPRLMEIAQKFLAYGVPLHCDKPCGDGLEPYRALVTYARRNDLPFQIGYMYRGNPALKWIWDYVAAGKLGEVKFIEADMNHDYGKPSADYLRYLSQFPGGIFYNLGCHLVDMIQPMVEGEIKSVRDFSRTPDDAGVLLEYPGTDVLLRTAAGRPGSIDSRRLRIDGTLGTIDLCPIERFDGKALFLKLLDGEEHILDFGVQNDRFAPQLLDLAAIVRREKPNDQDYDRDLHVHDSLLKIICRSVDDNKKSRTQNAPGFWYNMRHGNEATENTVQHPELQNGSG